MLPVLPATQAPLHILTKIISRPTQKKHTHIDTHRGNDSKSAPDTIMLHYRFEFANEHGAELQLVIIVARKAA